MTSSDAPPPPGGPLREDAPDGPIQPGADDRDSPADAPDSPDTDVETPAVTGEPTQSEDAADLQEENAETSLDQPSQ